MSLWQFTAVCDGYRRANDPDSDKEITSFEEDALWNWIQEGKPN